MKTTIVVTCRSESRMTQLITFALIQGIEEKDIRIWRFSGDEPEETVSGYGKVMISPMFSPVNYMDEYVLQAIKESDPEHDTELFLFDAADAALAIRLGIIYDGSSMTDVECLRNEPDMHALYVCRPAFSQNLKAYYTLRKKPWCVSVDKQVYNQISTENLKNANLTQPVVCVHKMLNIKPLKQYFDVLSYGKNQKKDTLETARRVVIIGRGVQGDLQLVYDFAKRIDAEIGASRAAVMDGRVPDGTVVGCSGAILKADLCIVLGVSGAMPFVYGLKQVKTVISVNTDNNAPIFSASDWGFCMDWKKFIRIWMDEV